MRQLIKHAQRTYLMGISPLSLAEVDLLISHLRRFDHKHPTLSVSPWGWRVTPNVPHPYHRITDIPNKYGSLENIPEAFCTGRWVITPKLEGVSVIAYYKNSLLRQCVTQGDGERGWDVTNNILARVPIVIYPNKDNRRERFTGYVRCVATVNIASFYNCRAKTAPIIETVNKLLTADSAVPKTHSYLSMIPISIYNAPYEQFMRISSLGWRVYLRDFVNKCKHLTVTSNHFSYLTEETAASLSGAYPYNGLVVRGYSIEDKLQRVFTYRLSGKVETVETQVLDVRWVTSRYGKIRPVVCIPAIRLEFKGGRKHTVSEVSGLSYRFMAERQIGCGTQLVLRPKKRSTVSIQGVEAPTVFNRGGVQCQYGCDTEFIEIDGAHAYCRNPKCPSTTLAMFRQVLRIFAPRYFYKQMRREVMAHFHNDVFEMWSYYKSMPDIRTSSELIDKLSDNGKQRCCEFLEKMLKWELTLSQLIKLCGIEQMGEATTAIIVSKASTNAELTQWAECATTLTEDWGIPARVSANWARRHYLVKEVLKYFRLIR